jgi:hypothetical protein
MQAEIDTSKPHAARIYDYLLGGYHNFAVDRSVAERAAAIYPDFPLIMRANRAFLRRAVTFLCAQGIDQFLDIGSGIPTAGNVHEVAQALIPQAHVAYVDGDPIAIAHSRQILRDVPTATAIQADARDPAAILAHLEVRRLLDLQRPLGVLLVSLLHFIPDDAEVQRLVDALRSVMAPGSYLVLSHASYDHADAATMAQLEALYAGSGNRVRPRSHDQLSTFFTGLEMVEPGLVDMPLWRPEGPDDLFLEQPERVFGYAGVGRKP